MPSNITQDLILSGSHVKISLSKAGSNLDIFQPGDPVDASETFNKQMYQHVDYCYGVMPDSNYL